MESRGVRMGISWRAAGWTMPYRCGKQRPMLECRPCAIPITSTPPSSAWRGVQIAGFWPVEAISERYRCGKCPQECVNGAFRLGSTQPDESSLAAHDRPIDALLWTLPTPVPLADSFHWPETCYLDSTACRSRRCRTD